jgi:hypothetical protein
MTISESNWILPEMAGEEFSQRGGILHSQRSEIEPERVKK